MYFYVYIYIYVYIYTHMFPVVSYRRALHMVSEIPMQGSGNQGFDNIYVGG